MKALSIRQPWTWAILHAGKSIENRDWKESSPSLSQARALVRSGERFLLHASAAMTRKEQTDFNIAYAMIRPDTDAPGAPVKHAMCFGGIVGIARIVYIIREDISAEGYAHRASADVAAARNSPWFFGPVGLLLADVKQLPFVPFKGALGFFDVPDDLVRETRAS